MGIPPEIIQQGREHISRWHNLSPNCLSFLGVQTADGPDLPYIILLYNVTDPTHSRYRSTLSWVVPG